MTVVVKTIIGLGTIAVGGTGTYLTYDYLNKNRSNTVETQNEISAIVDPSPVKDAPEKQCNSDEESGCTRS